MRALANGLVRLILFVLVVGAMVGCSALRGSVPHPPPRLDDAFWRDVFDIPTPKEKKP